MNRHRTVRDFVSKTNQTSWRQDLAAGFSAFVVVLAGTCWPTVALPQTASAPASSASAAGADPSAGTAFDVLTAEAVDLGAPDSPRASLAHYFDAVRAGRWDDAARYLVLDRTQKARGGELAQRLKAVIDDTGWIDLESVSDLHEGRVDDGLPRSLEDVTRVNLLGRAEPVRMVRLDEESGKYWAFSPATVKRIDAWYEALPDRMLRDAFVRTGLDVMVRPGPLELLWWQWFALVALLTAATIVGSLLGRMTRAVLRQIATRTRAHSGDEWIASLAGPLTLAWGLVLVWAGSQYLLLVKPAYRLIDGLTTAGIVFALFLALWRGTGAGLRILLDRPWAHDNAAAHTLVSVGADFARGALIVAGALAVLSTLGYPVGALLAGLGIGGLALAFGAQKTIENVFGSVSIAVDQPFRVGDSVSVGGVTGVVESIGLRSTRLRTADRTLIAIPNGKLADERTESHAACDRFRLASTIGLTYDTTREQLQTVLAGIQRVLREHPHIWPEGVAVNFAAFGESSLDVEVLAWFEVSTRSDFVSCREEVLLDIMRVVRDAGTEFAFPTRTVHLVGSAASRVESAS